MEEDAVCETTFTEHEVTSDVAECATVLEEVCRDDPTTGSHVCKSFPKQACTVVPVTKTEHVPETECKKIQTPVCGPEACPLTKGDPICFDEIKEVVNQVPAEKCDLTPQKMCSQVPKFVPGLEMSETCTKVPKEVCHKQKGNPKLVTRQIAKKWCGPEDSTDARRRKSKLPPRPTGIL